MIHRIGPKIRSLRKEQQIRLVQLAEAANMSPALLSKIENGRIIPTIPKLLDLIGILGIEPQVFFAEINGEDEFSGYLLLRKADFSPYVKEESAIGFHYQSILEYAFKSDIHTFQISFVTLDPENSRPKVSTDAHEFLFIIEGEIAYHLEDEVLDLQAGDALFFDGKIPHVPINKLNSPATYLVIYFFLKDPEGEGK